MRELKTKELVSSFLECACKAQLAITTDNIEELFPKVFSELSEIKSVLSTHFFTTFCLYGPNYTVLVNKILRDMECVLNLLLSSAKNKTYPHITKWTKSIVETNASIEVVDYESKAFRNILDIFNYNKETSPVKLSLTKHKGEVSLDVSISKIPFLLCYLYRDEDLLCGIYSEVPNIKFGEGAKDKISAMMISIISGATSSYTISSTTINQNVYILIDIGGTKHLFCYVSELNLFKIVNSKIISDEEINRINLALSGNIEWTINSQTAHNQLIFRLWEDIAYPEYSVA